MNKGSLHVCSSLKLRASASVTTVSPGMRRQ
jgi:hypothetical protein